MAPPGRRRTVSSFALLPLLFLFFTSTASAASAVLGIDLGTEYIKAALVKPGIPLEIVLTKDSKRKEAAAVAFKPVSKAPPAAGSFPERLYGGDALALTARFPGDVYPNLKPLLGLPAEGSQTVEEYARRYPALRLEAATDRGTVGFKSGSFSSEDAPFSVEELLAMELKNIRQNAETMAGKGSRIDTAVFTIPTFYTAQERRAVELAAELAGLEVLSLISDGLAVGLNFATTRTFPSISEGGKPETHMILDMGAGSTTATVINFQGRTVKDVGRFNKTIQEVQVLGTGWDKSLGGDALNTLIMDDMISKFVASSGAKSASVSAEAVKSYGRAAAKLWKEAERLRQVLSANTAASASFEGLYEDVDFKYKLTRDEFEELAGGFTDRIADPVKQAVEAAKISFSELDSIILHGGATRSPFVSKALGPMVYGDRLRSSVNADEAAVFGAAFKGAGLSPSFRVKEIKDYDVASYPAGIRWMVDGKPKSQKLFTPTSHLGAIKHVPFKNQEDFKFTLFQQVPPHDPVGDVTFEQSVVNVQTKNLTASVKELVEKFGCAAEAIDTKFSVRLDPVNGLPQVVGGTVSCEVLDDKKGTIADGVKDFFGFGKKDKGDQEVLEDGESASLVEESPTSSVSNDKASSTSSSKGAEKSGEAKKKTEIIKINFTSSPAGFEAPTPEELARMKKRLADFDKSDKNRRAREGDLNALEAFTYRARDLLSDEGILAASTSEQRSAIESLLSTTSEWLYSEGVSAPSETLKEKLNDLKALVEPMTKRKFEAAQRPEALRLLQEALNNTSNFMKMMKEQIEESEVASSKAEASRSAEAASSAASPSFSDSADADAEADPLADMDSDEPVTATTASSSKSPLQTLLSPYTPDELSSISSIYETAESWLKEKLPLQESKEAYEDAAFEVKDLSKYADQLNDALRDMMNKKIRQMQYQQPPKAKKSSKTSKTKKAKATKAASDSEKGSEEELFEDADKGAGKKSDDGEREGFEQVTVTLGEEEATATPASAKKGKAKAKGRGKSDKAAKGKGKKGKKDKDEL
ncbi:hypothetical protein LTS18_011895 [Coniosporium uncinatum]|uniref:Uncharacterized protein n=1 Tax=Coniosporium uncinatum TaxID=93489 RepID=A0ACC3DDF0_9PEZI|nr:hypothetical protein LTS18_011895 [Coniosporium uncinatum]